MNQVFHFWWRQFFCLIRTRDFISYTNIYDKTDGWIITWWRKWDAKFSSHPFFTYLVLRTFYLSIPCREFWVHSHDVAREKARKYCESSWYSSKSLTLCWRNCCSIGSCTFDCYYCLKGTLMSYFELQLLAEDRMSTFCVNELKFKYEISHEFFQFLDLVEMIGNLSLGLCWVTLSFHLLHVNDCAEWQVLWIDSWVFVVSEQLHSMMHLNGNEEINLKNVFEKKLSSSLMLQRKSYVYRNFDTQMGP